VGLKRGLFNGGLSTFFSVLFWHVRQTPTLYVFFMDCFFLYGIYASATEGISKAVDFQISQQKKIPATAIGHFQDSEAFAPCIASSLAGLIWLSVWKAEILF